ncbi:MAG: NTP transferase domain-containing protein [Clostridia bacterium]|nr:NTP transferase domain-containing protein [Clostridia bacterium]
MQVKNAIIMAAGTSSRFTPLSYEQHKAMTVVKGEVLIERQIRQLQQAGVPQVIIVTGYKAEQFEYLQKKFGVKLVHNGDYLNRNNNGSIWAVREELGNSYICSADNYFARNPFETDVEESYYAAVYANGPTAEWCMEEDEKGYISSVTIGGENAWYMLGHTFWSTEFSSRFLSILEKEYDCPETRDKLWEKIFMEHLDVLKMKIRRYDADVIYEFDSLDELREFDPSYVTDTRSKVLKTISSELGIPEGDLCHMKPWKNETNEAAGFTFDSPMGTFAYRFLDGKLIRQ